MCGIAGFIDFQPRCDTPTRAAILESMCRVLTHRGPDDQGLLLTPQASLGMRRLSIIDLGGGHQPLYGCDENVSVVFNGEIYNYRALQKQLESLGHRFRTHSDTEILPHAYEAYGADCVTHLRGMFAFAVWDEKQRKLLLARDRVGKKPLYYTITPTGALVFGSELKAVLMHPDVRREINTEALDAYLSFGYVPDPLCIFRDVHKLPPGHSLTFDDSGARLQSYWDFTFAPATQPVADYVEELRALLEESVRLRLISDVPLGAFLSGGLDSSAVVGFMARAQGAAVKTFSIGFREDEYNELKYARIAAQHFGTEHHELIVTPNVCDVVDKLVWHLDEPFADSSAIPNYVVAQLAREYVTVALSGDGGDELFAGYLRYHPAYWQSPWTRLPQSFRRGVMQRLGRRLPHGSWGRNYIHDVAFDPLERYIENISYFSRLAKRSLYSPGFRAQAPPAQAAPEAFHAYATRVHAGSGTDALLYLDSKTYLPGDILTKVDRTSMAVSLEVRAPLLDHKLIEAVTRIPAELKLKDADFKYIFKQAVQDIVPPEILTRSKQGFGIPIEQWLNQQLQDRVRSTLNEPRMRQRGYFNNRYINLLLSEHQRGRRNHAARVWNLFMLELWHRQFVDEVQALRAVSSKATLPIQLTSPATVV